MPQVWLKSSDYYHSVDTSIIMIIYKYICLTVIHLGRCIPYFNHAIGQTDILQWSDTCGTWNWNNDASLCRHSKICVYDIQMLGRGGNYHLELWYYLNIIRNVARLCHSDINTISFLKWEFWYCQGTILILKRAPCCQWPSGISVNINRIQVPYVCILHVAAMFWGS